MAKKLKCVIFGLTDVIVTDGKRSEVIYKQIGLLIRFLLSKGILPIFFGNVQWVITIDGIKHDLQEIITKDWGEFPWFIAQRDHIPGKPSKDSTEYILNKYNFDTSEVVYVGNTERDMRTAVNGNLLFLNANWFNKSIDYGFCFDSPLDIARFIDTFCLRESLWHYIIEENNLRYYALSPFSTYFKEFEFLSSDARNAKFGYGHVDFWMKYLISTIYFSEIHKEIDYIAVVPGSGQGSGNKVMEDVMTIFAKCFRIHYLSDLILRHTSIEKSHILRNRGEQVNHIRQFNSIVLNKFPLKNPGVPYIHCPLKREKCVLLIDDICTNGYSLETAKIFINQTGADVISMTWLKTVNRGYIQILDPLKFDPFSSITIDQIDQVREFDYHQYINDNTAPEELTRKLKAYDDWKWPV